MIEAVGLLPEEMNARLILAGRFFPAELETEVKRLPGWRNVEYLGLIPYNQVRDTLASSDLGLVILHPVGQYKRAEPVKLFEYFERGLPVVSSDFPAYVPFVEKTGAGVMVDPLSPRAVADAALVSTGEFTRFVSGWAGEVSGALLPGPAGCSGPRNRRSRSGGLASQDWNFNRTLRE